MREGNDGYQEAEYIAKTHRCPDCEDKARLVVRWDFARKRNMAVCGVCGRSSAFVRRKSLTELWKENPGSVPIAIANRLAEKHRHEIDVLAEGLPAKLGNAIREHYGLTPDDEERTSCP